MSNEERTKTDTIFFEYVELLDPSQAEDGVNYMAFRVEEAMYKRITKEREIIVSWHEFMVKIRDTAELTSLIDDIIIKSLDDVKAEQYDFERTERPISWFDKTSHDFGSFIKFSHSKKTIGYTYKVMYWAERLFYDRAGGLEDKDMWLTFCNKIISDETLHSRIYRGFLHALVEIDFEKYIPDLNTLLALFQ